MIDKWFNEEVQTSFTDHRYIVITDAKGEGEFAKILTSRNSCIKC